MKPEITRLIVFAVPTLASIGAQGFLAWFSQRPIGYFDHSGSAWIVLKGIYHGLLALCVYACYVNLTSRSLWVIGTVGLLILLALLDFKRGGFDESLFDKFASTIGYGISRVFPYRAQDTNIPDGSQSVLPSNSLLTATTSIGLVAIKSERGCFRSITLDGQTRDICLLADRTSRDLIFPDPSRRGKDTGYCWADLQGIKRCFFREGIRRFDSVDEADHWINEMLRAEPTILVSRDGLILVVSKFSNKEALNISLYQVAVPGHIFNIPDSTRAISLQSSTR